MNNYYYDALKLSLQSDITSALNMLHPYKDEIPEVKKLYGLCLYRYGDYEKAYMYLQNFKEYAEESKIAKKRFETYKSRIILLINKGRIKQALSVHKTLNGGSATEKNIEGCLYALMGKTKSAEKSFIDALLLDKGNRQAIDFIGALSKDGFIDRIKGFFK